MRDPGAGRRVPAPNPDPDPDRFQARSGRCFQETPMEIPPAGGHIFGERSKMPGGSPASFASSRHEEGWYLPDGGTTMRTRVLQGFSPGVVMTAGLLAAVYAVNIIRGRSRVA